MGRLTHSRSILLSRTTRKGRVNIFFKIYFEHIGELLNHLRLEEPRSQKEGKLLEVNMMVYTSSSLKVLQVSKHLEWRENKQMLKDVETKHSFRQSYRVGETKIGVQGYRGSQDWRGQDFREKGIAQK